MANATLAKTAVPAVAPVASPVPVPQTVLQPSSGTVLTVGTGMEFATLADALKASVDGDTIAVQAGTYTNDFGTVTTQVHMVAVGGMVNEVATVVPPNGKGILTVDNSLSIQGFTFTGGSDGSEWGNIAGLRLENGNLNVSYCYFHDMEEGLLAGADSTASVTIDHSEFGHNGSGDGLTHNIYVGAVASLSITNSYFHDAIVGHEIKSRAAVTTITNNVIADGPAGTASYDIDLPNGGVATVAGNIIEKGANASNWYAIHYGGETNYAWAKNSLSVTGNTIINDLPVTTGVAVLNQSAVNGLSVSAAVSGNKFYGFDAARLVQGAGTLSGNTNLSTEPGYSQASPWTAEPLVALASGPALLNLSNAGHTVTGGVGKLTVNDAGGSNTIAGGSGGLTLTSSTGWDVITTQAGASDVLNLPTLGNVVHAAGNDRISVTGNYQTVVVTGQSTITGSTYSNYGLNGAGEKLTSSCSCVLSVGSAGNAGVTDTSGDIQLTIAAGGTLSILDQAATIRGGAASAAVVDSGAVTGWIGNSGVISLTTGTHGARVQAGSGAVSVVGGSGADTLVAGAGNDTFTLGAGADQVTFGSGNASVSGGTGADSYTFRSGAHGNDSIAGFKQGVDSLHMTGFTGTSISSGSIVGGSTLLTLADGTKIDLVSVVLPGYPVAGAGGGGSGGSGGTGTLSSTAGTVTLSRGGQVLTGNGTPMIVNDLVGGNTVNGGAGGLSISAGTADLITTAALATDKLALYRYDTVTGAGSDQVSASANGNLISESGTATITLLGGGNVVQGGAGQIHVSDVVSGDTVSGGAGGLVAALAATYDVVSTQAGAADTVSLGGRDVMISRGNDQISVSGLYNQLTATGTASIVTGAGCGTYDLEGADTLTASGSASVTIGQHASATVASSGGDGVSMVKLAGGLLAASESLPGGVSTLSVSGGAATVSAAAGAYAGLTAYATGGVGFIAGTGTVGLTSGALAGGPGDTITGGSGSLVASATGSQGLDVLAGAGNVTLNGGSGNDVFVGGAGQALLNLGNGADTVTLGQGSITVRGGAADTFVVPGSATGLLVVQNWTAQDALVTPGQAQPSITADTVTGGSTFLTLSGGAHIELVGVTHFT